MTRLERLLERMYRDGERYAAAREAFMEAELALVKAKSSFRRSRRNFTQAAAKARDSQKRKR